MANAFPAWVEPGDPSNAAWDTVQLGPVFLPGVCSIGDFEYGADIDVQKRRKKEKAKIRDNGLAPVAFDITCRITELEWAQFTKILPQIKPKEGATRSPLQIVHPLVNLFGVKDIYIHKIRIGTPTARAGMTITIRCAEWFEQEKDSGGAGNGNPNSKKVRLAKANYTGDPKKLAARLAAFENQIPPTDSATVLERLIGAAENTPNPLFEE